MERWLCERQLRLYRADTHPSTGQIRVSGVVRLELYPVFG